MKNWVVNLNNKRSGVRYTKWPQANSKRDAEEAAKKLCVSENGASKNDLEVTDSHEASARD